MLMYSGFYLKFLQVKSLREYEKRLKTLFFRFSLVSEQTFLNTKIIDN